MLTCRSVQLYFLRQSFFSDPNQIRFKGFGSAGNRLESFCTFKHIAQLLENCRLIAILKNLDCKIAAGTKHRLRVPDCHLYKTSRPRRIYSAVSSSERSCITNNKIKRTMSLYLITYRLFIQVALNEHQIIPFYVFCKGIKIARNDFPSAVKGTEQKCCPASWRRAEVKNLIVLLDHTEFFVDFFELIHRTSRVSLRKCLSRPKIWLCITISSHISIFGLK